MESDKSLDVCPVCNDTRKMYVPTPTVGGGYYTDCYKCLSIKIFKPNKSISESNEKLNEYAKKMNLDFTKPTDFALGWRLCFDWLND